MIFSLVGGGRGGHIQKGEVRVETAQQTTSQAKSGKLFEIFFFIARKHL